MGLMSMLMEGGMAMYFSWLRGDEQVVRSLLEKGADVNAQGETYGSALQAASYEGHEKVVMMLLEKGSGVLAWLGLKATGFGLALSGLGFGLALAWLGPSHGLEVQNEPEGAWLLIEYMWEK
jgi:hypothetical protein